MKKTEAKIKQIVPAQPGWYAVHDDGTGEEWCTPVLCFGLANGTLHALGTDAQISYLLGDMADFRGLIYAPHLIYKNHLLWSVDGERADFAHFLP